MWINWIRVELWLEGCHSLKDKRQILRSISDRLRRHFSVAEVDMQDKWQRGVLGIVTVAADGHTGRQALQQAVDMMESHDGVSGIQVEWGECHDI